MGFGVSLREKKEVCLFGKGKKKLGAAKEGDAIEGRTRKAPKEASSERKWGGQPLIGRLSAGKYRYSILHGWASVIVRCKRWEIDSAVNEPGTLMPWRRAA